MAIAQTQVLSVRNRIASRLREQKIQRIDSFEFYFLARVMVNTIYCTKQISKSVFSITNIHSHERCINRALMMRRWRLLPLFVMEMRGKLETFFSGRGRLPLIFFFSSSFLYVTRTSIYEYLSLMCAQRAHTEAHPSCAECVIEGLDPDSLLSDYQSQFQRPCLYKGEKKK